VGVVGYWHDRGIAATMERLGSTQHEEWLRRHAGRLIGIHLHDIDSHRDHQCPGNGRLDWSMVSRYLPADAIRVCELGEWNDIECVARAPSFLARMGVIGTPIEHNQVS
jgi:sugar phosphate isomerase/epimerase